MQHLHILIRYLFRLKELNSTKVWKNIDMLQLVDWIKQHNCTHVAMESTSVYWKPIVNLPEAGDIEFAHPALKE
jgi:hypothetical protein